VSNRFHTRYIPDNAIKHWSVAKLRACEVDGVGALQWINDNDTKFNFAEQMSAASDLRIVRTEPLAETSAT
jgi:hypothetical protein